MTASSFLRHSSNGLRRANVWRRSQVKAARRQATSITATCTSMCAVDTCINTNNVVVMCRSVAELFASGAYDAALKKLKSETQSGKVLFNTGLVHMKAGNLSEARRVLGEALTKDKYGVVYIYGCVLVDVVLAGILLSAIFNVVRLRYAPKTIR